jgi:hypothetical protein
VAPTHLERLKIFDGVSHTRSRKTGHPSRKKKRPASMRRPGESDAGLVGKSLVIALPSQGVLTL